MMNYIRKLLNMNIDKYLKILFLYIFMPLFIAGFLNFHVTGESSILEKLLVGGQKTKETALKEGSLMTSIPRDIQPHQEKNETQEPTSNSNGGYCKSLECGNIFIDDVSTCNTMTCCELLDGTWEWHNTLEGCVDAQWDSYRRIRTVSDVEGLDIESLKHSNAKSDSNNDYKYDDSLNDSEYDSDLIECEVFYVATMEAVTYKFGSEQRCEEAKKSAEERNNEYLDLLVDVYESYKESVDACKVRVNEDFESDIVSCSAYMGATHAEKECFRIVGEKRNKALKACEN